MIVKVATSEDLRSLSSEERAEFEAYMVKFKKMMLHSTLEAI